MDMDIIFYTRNVNYLKLYSVLAETFYLGFITFYACTPFIYHGLLWIIINILCCTCKYFTWFYWIWDVLHAKWHGYP